MSDLLASLYPWIKALHIAAVIFWMAAMMYLPRLYVYHHQSIKGGEMETALLEQERRLLKIIMTPAMIGSLFLGLILLGLKSEELQRISWLWVKLLLLIGLFGFHGILAADRKKFAVGERPRSERTYRILNELPAFLIIIIVILAVVKPF